MFVPTALGTTANPTRATPNTAAPTRTARTGQTTATVTTASAPSRKCHSGKDMVPDGKVRVRTPAVSISTVPIAIAGRRRLGSTSATVTTISPSHRPASGLNRHATSAATTAAR